MKVTFIGFDDAADAAIVVVVVVVGCVVVVVVVVVAGSGGGGGGFVAACFVMAPEFGPNKSLSTENRSTGFLWRVLSMF
jgi:hypothetical protein